MINKKKQLKSINQSGFTSDRKGPLVHR